MSHSSFYFALITLTSLACACASTSTSEQADSAADTVATSPQTAPSNQTASPADLPISNEHSDAQNVSQDQHEPIQAESPSQTFDAPQTHDTFMQLDNVETWYDDVKNNTDTNYLDNAFRANQYDPGPDAYAFIAEIKSNSNNRESYKFYSYKDSAFIYSLTPDGEERYWPASTVKLTAAVMALMRAESFGVSIDDPVTFVELDETVNSTLRKLVRDAIIPSDNQAYNALMLITGLDRANDTYIRNTFHFPSMVLQRRYFRKAKEDNLRHSPTFTFDHNGKTIIIPEETSTHYFEHVPREANATTLVELAEILRRVMTGDMLSLSEDHFTLLRDALLEAPSCIGDGVERALPGARIYNKGGRVIGDDRLEVAYITDKNNTPKYLLALSLPYSDDVELRTQEFAWQLIHALQIK